MIPLCDLKQQYLAIKDDVDEAIRQVLAECQFILGPNVKAFESEIAEYCGCPFAAGVGNGTDAMHLALRALGVGPGDEVITTPFTFIATTEAIGIVGARPVFVDIDPVTFNIDPAKIEPAITDRTKAILSGPFVRPAVRYGPDHKNRFPTQFAGGRRLRPSHRCHVQRTEGRHVRRCRLL